LRSSITENALGNARVTATVTVSGDRSPAIRACDAPRAIASRMRAFVSRTPSRIAS